MRTEENTRGLAEIMVFGTLGLVPALGAFALGLAAILSDLTALACVLFGAAATTFVLLFLAVAGDLQDYAKRQAGQAGQQIEMAVRDLRAVTGGELGINQEWINRYVLLEQEDDLVAKAHRRTGPTAADRRLGRA